MVSVCLGVAKDNSFCTCMNLKMLIVQQTANKWIKGGLARKTWSLKCGNNNNILNSEWLWKLFNIHPIVIIIIFVSCPILILNPNALHLRNKHIFLHLAENAWIGFCTHIGQIYPLILYNFDEALYIYDCTIENNNVNDNQCIIILGIKRLEEKLYVVFAGLCFVYVHRTSMERILYIHESIYALSGRLQSAC